MGVFYQKSDRAQQLKMNYYNLIRGSGYENGFGQAIKISVSG